MRRRLVLGVAASAAFVAVLAQAGERTVGAWVSAGGPYGIWEKSYGRSFPVEIIVKGLLDVGVNEVLFFDQGGRGGPFSHPTKVPGATSEKRMGDRDFVRELLEETQKHGIGVWLAWTPPDGKYPGTDFGGLNDPRLLRLYCDMVEEVGRNYGQYKNLRGIHWHEVDCAEAVDEHQDDVAEFAAFCTSQFGETYGGQAMPAMDPADRWFRRFVLYRQQVVNNLVAATRKAGEPFGLRMSFCYYAPEAYRGESWRWGYDVLALEGLCEHQWFSGYGEESGKAYQTITGAWIDFGPSYRGVILPRNYSYGFHGAPLWFFEHRSPVFLSETRKYYDQVKGWKEKYGDFYVGYAGHSEKEVEVFLGRENVARWIGAMARWQGGESPAKVAVAINPTPFIMKYPLAPEGEYGKKVRDLLLALSGVTDVDAFVVGSRFALTPANLRRYSLIIVPQDMGDGLSEAMVGSLREYLAKGGALLAMATPLLQSRPDLTGSNDLTRDLLGVEVLQARLPGYVRPQGDLAPADARKQWASKLVDVRADGAEVVLKDGLTGAPLVLRRGNAWFSAMGFAAESAELVTRVVCAAAAPPVTLAGSGAMRILESVRKDGAVCLALWGVGEARLVVDAAALGLKPGTLQARDIVTGAVLAEGDAALQQGVPVAIRYPNQPLIVAIGPAAVLAEFTGLYPSAEAFKGMTEVVAQENPEVPTIVPDKPGIRVGVYHAGTGAGALLAALRQQPGLNCFPLSRLDREALGKCQVVLLPQPASKVFFNRAREAVRDWVTAGGGVMLLHDAVGFKGLVPYFPEVGEGSRNPKTHEAVVAKGHPVTAGLAVGQTVRHAYTDHIAVTPGPQGEALLTDAPGLGALVVGKVGQGKVILNGMITGYASLAPGDYKGQEAAPTDAELRLLLNGVQWLAAED